MNDPSGADPAHPPYGWGTGLSAEAEGPRAFAVPPEPQLDVIAGDDFTRRRRRTNRQEQGFDPAFRAGYPGHAAESAAAHEVDPTATTAFPGDPEGSYGVTPPDDAGTAAPSVRV